MSDFRLPPIKRSGIWALVMLAGACSFKGSKDSRAYLNRVMKPLRLGKDTKEKTATEQALKVNAIYYYLLGQRLVAAGNTDEAIVAFERVRSLDPDAAYIHFALAQEYLKKGMSAEGVAMVKKAIELDPKNREARLLLASLYSTAKKFGEALVLYEELANEFPDDEEIVLNLALLELEQKNFDAALKRFHGFLERDPESALAYFYIGRLEQERGHKKDALKAYTKAVDLKGGFIQAGTYLGFLQEEMGDRKGAISTFVWLASQTDGARYHKKLGQLFLEDNQYEKSLTAFENFERVDPQDLNNKVKVGLLHIETKHPELAEKKFREVLKESPDSENVRFYLASVFEEMKKHAEALKEFERIPSTSKLYTESLKKRAAILQHEGKTDDGWKILDEALKSADKDDARYEEFAEIAAGFLASGKKSKEAESFLEKALVRVPDSERLLYSRGILLEREGRSDEAITSMKLILKKNPDHAAALNFVGFLWAERNTHLTEAEEMIRHALKLRPKDPFITDSLGWVLYRRGRYAESLKVLEAALASSPEESVIAEHLGDVLVKLGRVNDARSHYEKALRLGPEKESDKKNIEGKLSRLPQSRGKAHCRGADGDASQCSADGLREPRSPAAATKDSKLR